MPLNAYLPPRTIWRCYSCRKDWPYLNPWQRYRWYDQTGKINCHICLRPMTMVGTSDIPHPC